MPLATVRWISVNRDCIRNPLHLILNLPRAPTDVCGIADDNARLWNAGEQHWIGDADEIHLFTLNLRHDHPAPKLACRGSHRFLRLTFQRQDSNLPLRRPVASSSVTSASPIWSLSPAGVGRVEEDEEDEELDPVDPDPGFLLAGTGTVLTPSSFYMS
jgi:hypothetical protein